MPRCENGFPWDREQTHESLRKYLLEEAYEAAGAIDEGDIRDFFAVFRAALDANGIRVPVIYND